MPKYEADLGQAQQEDHRRQPTKGGGEGLQLPSQETGGRRMPTSRQVPDQEQCVPGNRGRDEGGRGGEGGDLCGGVCHHVEGEVPQPQQILQQPKLQGRDHSQHPHLGAQGPWLHLLHCLEGDRQGLPLHPHHQQVHALHQGEVLHPKKTGVGFPELKARSWNPLRPRCDVSPLESGESESDPASRDQLNALCLFLCYLTQSLICS